MDRCRQDLFNRLQSKHVRKIAIGLTSTRSMPMFSLNTAKPSASSIDDSVRNEYLHHFDSLESSDTKQSLIALTAV